MIVIEGLTKYFSEKKAVSDLDLVVKKGQVVGMLGPNGAGKSTCMKMITGNLRPSSGRILLAGHDMWTHPVDAKQHLGYRPESAPLYEDFTVGEYLTFFSRMRGARKKEVAAQVHKVVEDCFLQPVYHQLIATLSKGFRARVCLAQSLLGDPDILILDEPTDGLDPNQKHETRQLIRRMSPEKAIIISSHILDEIEVMCTDVLLINNGAKVFSGKPRELRANAKCLSRIRLMVSPCVSAQVLKALIGLDGIADGAVADETGEFVTFLLEPDQTDLFDRVALGRRIALCVKEQRAMIFELNYSNGELGDVFRRMTLGTSLKRDGSDDE